MAIFVMDAVKIGSIFYFQFSQGNVTKSLRWGRNEIFSIDT